MKRLILIAVFVAACGPAAASSPPSSAPSEVLASAPAATATPEPTAESHVLAGIVLVDGFHKNSQCDTTSGFDDIEVGTNVVIKDGEGKVIATDGLALSAEDDQADFLAWDDSLGGFPCRFAFAAPVPKADFYHITIGRRDGPTSSYGDLAGLGWKWDLTLGSS